MKHGDFDELALNYSKYRPGYSESVRNAILGLFSKEPHALKAADVGAGTGIWTRMLASEKISCVAIEPSDEMRTHGEMQSVGLPITWHKGSAEQTGLSSHAFDLVTMASSFHWPNFQQATHEFHRILNKGGRFVALWNPRVIDSSPLLEEIENYIRTLVPNLKRVSSGRSEFTETLKDRLLKTNYFEDIVYIEGCHTMKFSPEEFMGVWKSVNDIRVQAGEDKFKTFLDFVFEKTKDLPFIEQTYMTRAWASLVKSN